MKIIERKEDIACNEQCLLFPQCFSLYCIDKLPAILRSSEIVDSLTMVYRSYNMGPDRALELLHDFEPSTFELTRFYCIIFSN